MAITTLTVEPVFTLEMVGSINTSSDYNILKLKVNEMIQEYNSRLLSLESRMDAAEANIEVLLSKMHVPD